ncbi:MAG: biotin/lipoyl-containing protein [Gemmatimonadales bacterium]
MKFHVTLRSRTYVVEVDGGAVTVDGERLDAHWAAVAGTPLFHLLLGGASWTVAVQSLARDRWALGAGGERVEVDVVDDRTRQIEALTGRRPAPMQGGVITAPMPGLVVQVAVAVGERVAAGAGLMVVEAMKMENELRAPHPAVVAAVHVAAGARVEKGAPLVTLGPLPAADAPIAEPTS